MRSYNQYCPIVRASEILAERWTLVIVRNILLGCRTFTQIERGAPGISKTLLAQRLKELERAGIIRRVSNEPEPGHRYEPTDSGRELWDVCTAIGSWGARWLDVSPEHLDPYVVLWSMCNSLRTERLPDRRVVVRFDFTDRTKRNRFWLVLEHREGEVCVKHPGFEEDLVVRADSEWFAKWHMGWIPWSQAVRAGRIDVQGPSALARSFHTWDRLSSFAGVKPAPGIDVTPGTARRRVTRA